MTLGVALLGAGRIGAVHAGAIAQHSDSKLLYVRSRHPDTERLAARYHAHAVTDLDTIWGDPAVDAVVIATPTPTHCDLIEQAVAAGKAVLCEKPIDQNIERVEETWKRIGAEGASRVRIGFNRRFDPTFQLVREQLDAGSAGRLEAIHIVTRVVNPPSYRYVQGSGGLFRDMTIHDLDLLRFLVDEEPTRIYAAGSALVDPELAAYDDIDSAKLLLEYDSGMLVTIENSRRSAYGFDGRVEIFGSSGQVTARVGGAPDVSVSNAEGTGRRPRFAQAPDVAFGSSFARQWEAFADAISEARPIPGATFADGWAALSIAIAAKRSHQERQPVEIKGSFEEYMS